MRPTGRWQIEIANKLHADGSFTIYDLLPPDFTPNERVTLFQTAQELTRRGYLRTERVIKSRGKSRRWMTLFAKGKKPLDPVVPSYITIKVPIPEKENNE